MSGRRSFGPVVLAGLAAGALLAAAGSRVWVGYDVRPTQLRLVGSDLGEVPLAAALSYVLLAAWGVLLVTRGAVRRAFAVVAAATGLGLVACLVWAVVVVPGQVRDRFPGQGYTVTTGFTGWFWAAGIATVVAVVAGVLAVRLCGGWPEMGRRYDAPAARAVPSARPDADPDDPEAGNLALWKAIDEGQDPTDPTPASGADPEPDPQPGSEPGPH